MSSWQLEGIDSQINRECNVIKLGINQFSARKQQEGLGTVSDFMYVP
jgi:hypothetical protein